MPSNLGISNFSTTNLIQRSQWKWQFSNTLGDSWLHLLDAELAKNLKIALYDECTCTKSVMMEQVRSSLVVVDMLFTCVPLHEWATGSLPPTGRPPTRQVGPSRVHVSV